MKEVEISQIKRSKPVNVKKDGTVDNDSNGRATVKPGRFA